MRAAIPPIEPLSPSNPLMNNPLRLLSLVFAGSSLLLLSGCAEYDDGRYYHGHAYGNGYRGYDRGVYVQEDYRYGHPYGNDRYYVHNHDYDRHNYDHGSRNVTVVEENRRYQTNNYRSSYAQTNVKNGHGNYHGSGGSNSHYQASQGHGNYHGGNQPHNQPQAHAQPHAQPHNAPPQKGQVPPNNKKKKPNP